MNQTPSTETNASDEPVKNSQRILSIDALRGFDMFWIVGGDAVATKVLSAGDWSFSAPMLRQFDHVPWEGFVFYDLIFPLFLFLVGVVLPFSLEKYRSSPKQTYGRIARRTLLLFFLGLVYSDFLQFHFDQQRYVGVLQRIAICYGIAAVLFLHFQWKWRARIFVGILLGYWAILRFIPSPGGIAGDLSKEGNLAGYLDRAFLPGHIMPQYYGFGDNEGLLSTFPAIATALLGVFAGEWLRSNRTPWTIVSGLAGAGVVALLLGTCWSLNFPVIKNLWTSSFVLVAGGWSLLLLAVFYAVIDVLGWKRWAFFFTVIGMNAITIYLAKEIIDFEKISKFFLGGVIARTGSWSDPLMAVGIVVAEWLFLYVLYRKKIFLRV